MKERPILFSGPMVRAILDGRKTQTRRVVNPQPEIVQDGEILPDGTGGYCWEPVWPEGHKWAGRPLGGGCLYGQPGDRLWVRETWAGYRADAAANVVYRANGGAYTPEQVAAVKWRPSIHMPRWASRITLEVTGVRVERLQEISEADAQAEGVLLRETILSGAFGHFRLGYIDLWESINGTGSWALNPWVWVIEFRRVPA